MYSDNMTDAVWRPGSWLWKKPIRHHPKLTPRPPPLLLLLWRNTNILYMILLSRQTRLTPITLDCYHFTLGMWKCSLFYEPFLILQCAVQPVNQASVTFRLTLKLLNYTFCSSKFSLVSSLFVVQVRWVTWAIKRKLSWYCLLHLYNSV